MSIIVSLKVVYIYIIIIIIVIIVNIPNNYMSNI